MDLVFDTRLFPGETGVYRLNMLTCMMIHHNIQQLQGPEALEHGNVRKI